MRFLKIALICLISNQIQAQEKTLTLEKAMQILNSQSVPDIYDISENDAEYPLIKNGQPGDLLIIRNHIYKILAEKTITSYNAGYIFLDSKKLSQQELERLSSLILKKLEDGQSFKELSLQYTMDKNKTAFETKFVDGEMVPEFEAAVKSHAVGEVFTIEIPNKGWFHIVKKNEADKTLNAFTVQAGYSE